MADDIPDRENIVSGGIVLEKEQKNIGGKRMRQTYEGVYDNGIITLNEAAPFSGKQDVLVVFPGTDCGKTGNIVEGKIHTTEEILNIFNAFQIDTGGWNFNREEANER